MSQILHPKTPESYAGRAQFVTTPRSNFSISPFRVLSSSDSSDEDANNNNDQNAPTSSRLSIFSGLAKSNAENASENGTVIGENGSIHSSVLRRRRLRNEGRTEDNKIDAVLAFVWGAGKLGAAFYDAGTSQLHLLPDVAECAPDYMILRSLFSQVEPNFVLASQRQDQRMLDVLKSLCGDNIQNEANENNGNACEDDEGTGTKLILLPGRDFAPDACKKRLQSIRLPSEPKTNDDNEHLLFVTSLIPFKHEIMTRAAGGLLKFLDASGVALLQLDLVDGQVPVIDVVLISMNDLVMVDDSAWNSLQIFNLDVHPSANKVGTSSGSKEGISLFSWLNKCTTSQGSKYLRTMLLRPTRNVNLLNRRYDVIEFCSTSAHLDFMRAAIDCLKVMKSIPKLLFNLSLLRASPKDWKDLHTTFYNSMLLSSICAVQSSQLELFREIATQEYCEVLRHISQTVLSVIDFDESMSHERLVVNKGIDPVLDNKKKQFACLPQVMSLVASEEIQYLPLSIPQCTVVYFPEIGYLLCLPLTEEEKNATQVPLMDGFEFIFRNHHEAYYKSPRTRELDDTVGDCQVAIIDREMYIMVELTKFILNSSPLLIKVGSLIAELDCLLAIARVSADNNYIRPEIVSGQNNLKIVNGRHPLLEQLCDYMPNSTTLDDNKKVFILTGPNASGKSMYMKQVGAIVLMALSGIFVPAESAKIPIYDRICTRIHSIESVSSGMSSFMADISQMSLALRTATKDSLVLIDEYGKGTSEADGLSLLAASVRDFLKREENCPTVFLSTHFYSLAEYLDQSTAFKLQTMEYIKEGNNIVYLFRLIDGVTQTSFANLVAADIGIPDEIIRRNNEVEQSVRNQYGENEIIAPVGSNRNPREVQMVTDGREFLTLDFDSIDPRAYFYEIGRILGSGNKENVPF